MSDKRYFGEPCVNGHHGERYVSCNSCCECVADRVRRNRCTPAERALPQRRHGKIVRRPMVLPVDDTGFIRAPSRAQLMAGR